MWFLTKQGHFKEKVKVIKKKMWDLEFTKRRLEMMREDLRLEYDRNQEKITALNERVEIIKKIKGENEAKDLEDANKMIESGEKDSKQLKEQMESIDKQIEGGVEGGEAGIKALMAGYHSLIEQLTEHIKSL